MASKWEELMLFAQIKARPGLWLGEKSLLSLRDHLFGMQHAFRLCLHEDPMEYLSGFIEWYQGRGIGDFNGYASWWNHILYTSGNRDAEAFDEFFRAFERYLQEECATALPAPQWNQL